MKLSQIYTNHDNKFKSVRFTPGVNVILGKVTKPKDTGTDSHNLGKSTLIDVIDFSILKRVSQDHFLIKYPKFKDYVFFLEIKLNTPGYLTIRRSVAKPTKISFRLHEEEYQDFTELTEWDHKDVSFEKARKVLNEFLAFDVLPDTSYRNTISYFLRTQSDYQDIFQLHKFMRGDDAEWKAPVFSLLGFDGNIIEQKYRKENELTEENELIKKMSKSLSVSIEEADKISGLILIKDDEKGQIEKQLDNFDFYEKEKQINAELIDEIERGVSTLNSVEYDVDYEINKITDSLKTSINFDISATKKVFEEASIYFPDQLTKGYENLIAFNKEVSEERKKYLNERLENLISKKEATSEKLSGLNQKRIELLSFIKDVDSFKKFKNYQKSLIKLEAEITALRTQLDTIKSISLISDRKSILLADLEVLEKQVEEQINIGSEVYSSIRRTFTRIVKEVLNKPALISMKMNKNKNVEFRADLQMSEDGVVTAEGKGTSYKKLLCMAFDLSLLVNYSDKSFFRFVYHDGAMEALDNRKKLKFLDLVRDVSKKNRIQYILTSIEHDLPPVDKDGKPFEFKKGEIVLELTDEGDEGRLFEQSF